MRGPPPKPLEQKRRLGNPGKQKLPQVGSLALVPAADIDILQLPLVEAMERVLEEGVVWLAKTDIKLVLLREAIGDYHRIAETASAAERRKGREEIRMLMGDLGFDPTARSRLGLAEVKAASALEGLISKQRRKT